MYIWNVNSLVKDIKNRQLTEDEKVKYYISYTVLIMFAFGIGTVLPFNTDAKSSLLLILVNMTLTVVGIMLCNHKNKNIDNIDFIERSVIMGLPILIRVAVLVLIFNIAFVYMSEKGYDFMVYLNNTIFAFAFAIILIGTFFIFLYDGFNKLSQIKDPTGYFPKSDESIDID